MPAQYYVVRSADRTRNASARTPGGAAQLQIMWEAQGLGPCTIEIVRPGFDIAARNIAAALQMVACLHLGWRWCRFIGPPPGLVEAKLWVEER